MIKAIKRTIINWVNEHKKASYIIAGAVGLPLAFALGIGAFFGILYLLSLLFGTTIAGIIMIVVPVGAGVGYYLYTMSDND